MKKLILISFIAVNALYADNHNLEEFLKKKQDSSSLTDSSIAIPKCESIAPQNRPLYSLTMHQSDPKHGTAIQSADLTPFLRMLQKPNSNLEMVSFPYFNLEEVVINLSSKMGSSNAEKELSSILETLPGTVRELGTLRISVKCETEFPETLLTHNSDAELTKEENLSHEEILAGKFNSVPDCFNDESKGVYRLWKAANFSPAQAKSFSLLMNEIHNSSLKLMTAPRIEEIASRNSIIPWMRFEVKATKNDMKLLDNLKKSGLRLSCASSSSMPKIK